MCVDKTRPLVMPVVNAVMAQIGGFNALFTRTKQDEREGYMAKIIEASTCFSW